MSVVLPDGKLRRVEEDVLIPKIMREEAMKRCDKHVQAFIECCKGRTVTMAFKCRKENKDMKNCLVTNFQDPALFEECKKRLTKSRYLFSYA
ncbi:COX assembly mitochondrial protein homolog isoform X1 [Oscarella lobularis]|uniref:COX assembly mitochondrial protein homolog isoform X1 n=1 Tax=Oscarella lobularis TaxID=121494 RepID=UPI0033140213